MELVFMLGYYWDSFVCFAHSIRMTSANKINVGDRRLLKARDELPKRLSKYFHYFIFMMSIFDCSFDRLREEVIQGDALAQEKLAHQSKKDVKLGFGGKFGVQSDRMDKSAVGFDYHEKLASHASQKDYSTGFGGKFGVQKDRVDKSAVGWEHHEKVEKHESQKGNSFAFSYKILFLFLNLIQIIQLVSVENLVSKKIGLINLLLDGNIMKK